MGAVVCCSLNYSAHGGGRPCAASLSLSIPASITTSSLLPALDVGAYGGTTRRDGLSTYAHRCTRDCASLDPPGRCMRRRSLLDVFSLTQYLTAVCISRTLACDHALSPAYVVPLHKHTPPATASRRLLPRTSLRYLPRDHAANACTPLPVPSIHPSWRYNLPHMRCVKRRHGGGPGLAMNAAPVVARYHSCMRGSGSSGPVLVSRSLNVLFSCCKQNTFHFRAHNGRLG